MASTPVSRLQNILTASPASSYNHFSAMEAETMPPSRTLHTPGPDDFVVDPNSPYLESLPPSAAHTPAAPDGGNKRLGRFATLVKRVISQKRAASGDNFPTRTEKMSLPTHRVPSHSSQSAPSAGRHASSATSSDTVYSRHETDDNYDGTTAADHQVLPFASVQHGSPVYVEPQLAADYAKMETTPSSAGSINTLGSYMTRVQKFFHDINELPWVAERVTVDYVPGQSSRHRTQPLPPPPPPRTLHRPTSWYGNRPGLGDQFSIDPSSDSSSKLSPVSPPLAMAGAPPQTVPFAATALPPTKHPRPMRPPSGRKWKPTYPNGYVPHEEAASMAERYPGLSFHDVHRMSAAASAPTAEQV